MRKVSRVVVRLKGRSALAKLDLAKYVVVQMSGNTNFPTLADQVTALKTASDELDAAITLARTGDHEAVGLKAIAEAEVVQQLSLLCASVNGVAGGDYAKLLTCGFPLRRANAPIGELPPPVRLMNRLTSTAGRVQLDWFGSAGAQMYQVYMSTGNNPYNWEMIGVTTKQKFNADHLEPGKFYWFAVTAVGSAGESSKSEPNQAMAAA